MTTTDDGLLALGEVCDLLGVSATTVRKWVAGGKLEARRTAGGHRRITRRSVAGYIRARKLGDGGPPPTAAPSDAPCDLLLAEDDDVAALYVGGLLRRAAPGLAVRRVRDGTQAWQAIAQRRPLLVVSDLGMKPLDGFWLTWLLFLDNATRDIPVIVSSAYLDADVAGRAGLPPHVAWWRKPVDPEGFVAAVRQALGQAPAGA